MAVAAPPAAPAPAPAPPAKPSAPAPGGKPTVEKPVEQPVKDWLAEAGEELDTLDAEDRDRGKPKPDKKDDDDDPIKPPGKEGEKSDARGTDKETEKLDKKPGETEVEPKTAPELRKAYERGKKAAKELQTKLTTAEARVKELESAAPQDHAALQKEVETLRKRNGDLEGEIVFVNYQASQEFKTKYEAPYAEAYQDALGKVEKLTVESEGGDKRQATQDDLLVIANASYGEDRKLANALFGDSADDVLSLGRNLRDLAKKQETALKEARQNGVTRFEQNKTKLQEHNKRMGELWVQTNEGLAKKYPKFFAPVDGDHDGNKLLAEGFAKADELFTPDPKAAPKTPEQAVQLHALLRSKAANHDRLVLRVGKLRKENAELRKKLDQWEEAEPPGGGGRGPRNGKTGDEIKDAFAEIDSMDNKSL